MRGKIFLDLNNRKMAVTNVNGEIDIINLISKEIKSTLEGHRSQIQAICAIETDDINKQIIATSANDQTDYHILGYYNYEVYSCSRRCW